MTYKLKVLYSPMNILTEGKDCYQKTKVNIMQRTSSVALFHGKSLKFIGYLSLLGLLASVSFTTATARERDLLDAGWRFQMGDPGDVTTAVTSYPEIGDLTKLQDPTAEVTLEASRPDPVATQAGTNVSYVKTSYNDSGWQQINLPHDWVVGLPFDSSMAQNHGYKAGISGGTSANTIAWYRHTFTLPAGIRTRPCGWNLTDLSERVDLVERAVHRAGRQRVCAHSF